MTALVVGGLVALTIESMIVWRQRRLISVYRSAIEEDGRGPLIADRGAMRRDTHRRTA